MNTYGMPVEEFREVMFLRDLVGRNKISFQINWMGWRALLTWPIIQFIKCNQFGKYSKWILYLGPIEIVRWKFKG